MITKLLDVVPSWAYALALAGVGAFAGYQTLTLASERAQRAEERLEQAKAVMKSIEVAQGETIRMQGERDEAVKRGAQRAQRNAAAAAAAQSELDGLRDDLAAGRLDLPSRSHQACLDRAATLDTVFGQCARDLEALARKAQGHANDAMTLDEAWPTPSTEPQ